MHTQSHTRTHARRHKHTFTHACTHTHDSADKQWEKSPLWISHQAELRENTQNRCSKCVHSHAYGDANRSECAWVCVMQTHWHSNQCAGGIFVLKMWLYTCQSHHTQTNTHPLTLPYLPWSTNSNFAEWMFRDYCWVSVQVCNITDSFFQVTHPSFLHRSLESKRSIRICLTDGWPKLNKK